MGVIATSLPLEMSGSQNEGEAVPSPNLHKSGPSLHASSIWRFAGRDLGGFTAV